MEKQNTNKRRNRLFALRQIMPISNHTNSKVRKVVVKIGKPPPSDKIHNEIFGMFKGYSGL